MAGATVWIVLPVLFLGAAWAMACIAEGVARLFERFEPLEAYRLDIPGSLLGIVVFSVLSFLGTGPLVWGLVLVGGSSLLSPTADYVGRWFARGCGPGGAGAGFVRVARHVVSLLPGRRLRVQPAGQIPIRVNSLPHQSMLSFEDIRAQFYSEPYTHLIGDPGNVLIVGAGNGNDVALALIRAPPRRRRRDRSPLQRAGQRAAPGAPVPGPAGDPHIDDGRAFIERTDESTT